MINENSDFFKYVDNFAKTAHIPSIPIMESKLEYIPKVTIAIPTYKRADLLKEALDSALSQQDFDEYDVIVVDNHSERGDDTEKMMLTYHDSRLSYYKNADNLEMGGNWNRLFTLAKGEFVVILHDDDLLLSDALKTLYSNVSCLEAGSAVLGQKNTFYEKENKTYNHVYEETKLFGLLKIKDIYKLNNWDAYAADFSNCCGDILNKNSVIKLGGFDQDFYPSSDYAFLVKYYSEYTLYKTGKATSATRIGFNESFNCYQCFAESLYWLRIAVAQHFFSISMFLKQLSKVLYSRNKYDITSNFCSSKNKIKSNLFVFGIERIFHILVHISHYSLNNRTIIKWFGKCTLF